MKKELKTKHFIKHFNFKALTPQQGDEENFIIRGIFSTADEDRQGEVVATSGWNLDSFKANPVILFAHDHYRPAVAKCIELAIMNVDGKEVMAGAIQFAVKEDKSGLSETLYNLYFNKYMSAFSVGFMNDVYEYDQESDKVTLLENTLLEISCVNVPANAFALAASKGLNMKPLSDFIKEAEKGKKKDVEDIKEPKDADIETLEDEEEKEEEEEMNDDEKAVKEGIEKISKSNVETIKSAIETLTGVLKAETESGVKGRIANNGTEVKKIPVTLLNKAIKELLKVKELAKLKI